MHILKKLKLIGKKLAALPTGHLVGKEPIPETQNETWKFVIQKHDAERAGPHYDVRLASPEIGRGYSWAGRYLPEKKKEVRLFTRQPDHNVRYFDFEGKLTGYGAGTVKTYTKGEAFVHNSSPNKISFSYDNKKYVLLDTGKDKWLFIRVK